eukprot:scaffold82898_cov54-Phaeocystis_antarctica.AAC.3
MSRRRQSTLICRRAREEGRPPSRIPRGPTGTAASKRERRRAALLAAARAARTCGWAAEHLVWMWSVGTRWAWV